MKCSGITNILEENIMGVNGIFDFIIYYFLLWHKIKRNILFLFSKTYKEKTKKYLKTHNKIIF